MEHILEPGLVLYLPLYELDGDSFQSRDAHGHLCSVSGALWTMQGRQFDGMNDVINIASRPSLKLTTAITMEVWLKINSVVGVNDYLIDKAGATYGYRLFLETDEIRTQLYDGAALHSLVTTDFNLSPGVWYHIASTWDGSKIRCFKNCIASINTTSWSGTINNRDSDNLSIGSDNDGGNSYPSNTAIGEVRIYNRALSIAEIQHNHLTTGLRYR